jgi:hypothetical protein
MKTTFEAVVDGTSGDTWLMPVHAKFLNTEILREWRRRPLGRQRDASSRSTSPFRRVASKT